MKTVMMTSGLTNHDYDFAPRPVFYALQNTNALFSDTTFDPTIQLSAGASDLRRRSGFPFMSFGFRSVSGKEIVAYWLAAHSEPGNVSRTLYSTVSLKNTGIQHPVLIDVVTGNIRPVDWKKGTNDTLDLLPVSDSIMAIADADYFDWPVLPEAPSSLAAVRVGTSVKLAWNVHGGDPKQIIVERRAEKGNSRASWQRVAQLSASAKEYTDTDVSNAGKTAYRVKALNREGESATSNIVCISIP